MDPRYMDNYEFDTLNIAPLLRKKKSCEIRVVPDLLWLVSLLGVKKNLGWGEKTVCHNIF